jgi:hypothetical protein
MNRKLITTISIFLSVFSYSGAQKHPQLRYVSFDAGVNMSYFHPAGLYDLHQKNPGPHLAVSGDFSFSDSWSAGASLVFDRKGAVDPAHDINTNLNYLSLPVFMKWIAGKEPRFFLTTGFYSSWLLSAQIKGEQFINGQINRVNENATADFRSFDYGLILRGGMMTRLNDNLDFMVTVGGAAGLPDIANSPETSLRNYNLNLSLGYIYYIGYR